MNYDDLDESVQEFLSSVHGHLLALQELDTWSNKRIEQIEEHLDSIFEDLPFNLTKKKTKNMLRYRTKVDGETVELLLHIQNQNFTSYSVQGVEMPYYFRQEKWWKEC